MAVLSKVCGTPRKVLITAEQSAGPKVPLSFLEQDKVVHVGAQASIITCS